MPPKTKTLDSSSPDGKLRVLTLDGGGFRGLGMLLVIQEITKAANKRNRQPSDPQLKPHEIFDIVAGCSAGGLVSVLIGRLGLDCEAAISEYITLARALFGNDRSEFMKTLLEGKPFDDATVARYDGAIENLLGKFPGAQPTFYADPPTVAKTVVVTTTTTVQATPSFRIGNKTPGIAWTTKDAIRAATAAKTYMPAYIPTGEKAAFRDAVENRTINPKLAAKACWDDSQVGILVNIGQWFSAVDARLSGVSGFNAIKEEHATPFKADFLNGVPDPKSKANGVIQSYLKQAKEGLRRAEKSEEALSQAGVLKKLDPPLGPDSRVLELVDIFIEGDVRREVEKWALENAPLLTEIATRLVKEVVIQDDEIPDPIPNVHPFNPVLNGKKPREMLPYFNTYHVIFIVDDSTSMIMTDNYQGWNDNRWRQAEQSLGPIAEFTFNHNVTSVDMGFMHYQKRNPVRGIQSRKRVLDIFQQAKPPQNLSRIQRTPTGATLQFFLDEALRELNSKVNNPEAYQKIPPTDIILLTDGEADDDPKAVIRNIRQKMEQNKHNPNYIGIQIVQVGNSPLVKLHDMTQGDHGDMVDIVMSDGTDLTPEKLERIMLGGNHPTVRKKLRAQGTK